MNPDRTHTNLTEMPLPRAIAKMAIPSSLMMLAESLYHVVDAFWVGKLGAEPMASVTAVSFILWSLTSVGELGDVAAQTLVAQSVGAGNVERVRNRLRHCLTLAFFLGLALCMLILPLRKTMFDLVGLEPRVIAMASDYMLPWLIGLPVVFLTLPVLAAFRGLGDTSTPLKLMLVIVCVNAWLDPLMIWGVGPFEGLGLAGAAWASIICHVIALGLGAWLLHRRGFFPDLTRRWRGNLHWKWFGKIVSIGLPIASNGVLFSLIYVGLTKVIASFGSAPVAAIGLGHRIESFPYFIAVGFSMAATSLAGQYVGAGRYEDAAHAVWKTCLYCFVAIVPVVAVILVAIEPIVRFFIDDPAVVAICSEYLRIVGICWLIGFLEIVLTGAFSGVANSMPALLICTPLTAMRIPLAYLLAVTLDWGPSGVWWAIALSSVAKGLLMAFWFSRKRWIKTSVQAA